MRRAPLFLVISAIACSRPALIVPELPDGVTRAGAIFLDHAGAELAGTRLAPNDHGRFSAALEGPLPSWSEVWVFGFTDADLAAAGAPPPPLLDEVRLSFARDRAPLPSIRWSGRADADALEVRAATLDRPLTASFRPRCPILLPEPEGASVLTNCSDFRCAPLVRQVECHLEIDLSGCRLGVLTGTLDADGALSTETLEHLGRCSRAQSQRGEAFRLSCMKPPENACDLAFFARTTPPTAIVDTVPLPVPKAETLYTNLNRPVQGAVGGLILEDDRAVVVGLPAQLTSGHSCTPGQPAHVVFVDLDSLRITATATLPPCTREIAALPDGGYVGASGSNGGGLFRLDHSGAILERLPVPALAPYVPMKVIVKPSLNRGVAFFLANTSSSLEDGAAVWFELSPLSVLRVGATPTIETLDAVPLDGALVRLLDDGKDRMIDFDLELGAFTATVTLRPNPLSLRRHAMRLVTLDPLGVRTLVSNDDPDSGLILLEGSGADLIPTFERPMEPGAMWVDLDARTTWVSVHMTGAGRSGLVRYPHTGQVQEIPLGIWDVGEGSIGELAKDRSGRIWATLTEAGALARIRLTP